MILPLIDKLTTGTQILELVSWIIAPVVCVGGRRGLGGLTFGLSVILEVLFISDIIQTFDHVKSRSISQLIKEKEEISRNYSNIIMKQQLLWLTYFYQLVCFVLFLSHTQKIYLLLFCCYLSYKYQHHYFHSHHHSLHLYNNSTTLLMP